MYIMYMYILDTQRFLSIAVSWLWLCLWLFVIGLLSWDEPGVTLAWWVRKSNIYNHWYIVLNELEASVRSWSLQLLCIRHAVDRGRAMLQPMLQS